MPFRKIKGHELASCFRWRGLAACSRVAASYGAIEDAWLAMQIYLWLHGRPIHVSIDKAAEFRHVRQTRRVSTPLLLHTPNLRYHGRPASRPKIASW